MQVVLKRWSVCEPAFQLTKVMEKLRVPPTRRACLTMQTPGQHKAAFYNSSMIKCTLSELTSLQRGVRMTIGGHMGEDSLPSRSQSVRGASRAGTAADRGRYRLSPRRPQEPTEVSDIISLTPLKPL